MNGRIAAIASVAGTQNVTRLLGCAPTHPTPVLAIHGTADYSVPYDGINQSSQWASVASILDFWVKYNGCAPTPTVTPVPDIVKTDNSTVEQLVWAGGRNGTVVEHFRVLGGGHTWPSAPYLFGVTNFDISASVEVWRFLRRYRLGKLTAVEPPVVTAGPALEVWPVPTNDADLLYVRANTALQSADVALFDVLGRAVPVTAASAGGSLVLDAHQWAKGTY